MEGIIKNTNAYIFYPEISLPKYFPIDTYTHVKILIYNIILKIIIPFTHIYMCVNGIHLHTQSFL